MTPELRMTCDEVEAQLDAYLANGPDAAVAEAIEHHVSDCARCEARLEAATRIDLSSFAPPLPSAVRDKALAAIAKAAPVMDRPTPIATRWWGRAVSVTAIAAAALFYVVTTRETGTPLPADSVASASQGTPSTLNNDPVSSGARSMARAQAASEFQSLDAAAQELEAALKAAPSDPDVQAYLDAVKARRAELAEKVAEAAS